MASIALSGTETKKVVLKTVDGVQKVSCTCCGCLSLPTTPMTVVISGVVACPSFPSTSLPNGSYELEYSGDNQVRQWHLITETHDITLDCAVTLFSLFIYTIVGDELTQFSGDSTDLLNGTIISNGNDCDQGEPSASGGTATISWET